MLYPSKLITLILLAFMASGCAVNMPLSEGIIYHEENNEEGGSLFGIPTYEAGVGMTMLVLPINLMDEAREELQSEGEDREIIFRQLAQIAFPNPGAAFKLSERSALGVSVFPFPLAVDGTFHISGDLWATGSLQYFYAGRPNAEIILQRPFYRTYKGGFSAGAFFRADHIMYYTDNGFSAFAGIIPNTLTTNWFGLRLSGQFAGESDILNRFFFNAGYNQNLKEPMFAIGFSLGNYTRKRHRVPPLLSSPPYQF